MTERTYEVSTLYMSANDLQFCSFHFISSPVQEQEAVKVLMIMRQTVDKQRNQLRTLEKDATQKAADIDAVRKKKKQLLL